MGQSIGKSAVVQSIGKSAVVQSIGAFGRRKLASVSPRLSLGEVNYKKAIQNTTIQKYLSLQQIAQIQAEIKNKQKSGQSASTYNSVMKMLNGSNHKGKIDVATLIEQKLGDLGIAPAVPTKGNVFSLVGTREREYVKGLIGRRALYQ